MSQIGVQLLSRLFYRKLLLLAVLGRAPFFTSSFRQLLMSVRCYADLRVSTTRLQSSGPASPKAWLAVVAHIIYFCVSVSPSLRAYCLTLSCGAFLTDDTKRSDLINGPLPAYGDLTNICIELATFEVALGLALTPLAYFLTQASSALARYLFCSFATFISN